MLGAHVRAAEAAGDLGRERGARPAERDDRHVRAEVVRARGVGDGVGDLVDRAVEQDARGLLGRALHPGGQRREGGQRRGAGALGRLRRAVGRRARGGDRAVGGRGDVDEAERVRRARRGERVAAAVRRRDDGVLLGVAVARRDELERGALEVAGGGEAGVRQPGDVRAARAGLLDLAAADAAERAARRAHDPRVDRPDRRRAAHDAQRPQDRPAALDDAHVRARPAALEDDAVGERELVQRRRDAGGRAGADRERRRRAERLEAHGAAVAAQDEQRHVDAGIAQDALDDARGPLDDREDRRVHRRRDRPGLEAVRAGELVARAHGQPALAGARR